MLETSAILVLIQKANLDFKSYIEIYICIHYTDCSKFILGQNVVFNHVVLSVRQCVVNISYVMCSLSITPMLYHACVFILQV